MIWHHKHVHSEARIVGCCVPSFFHRGLSSPKSWSRDVAYSIMVDRFANGDLSNDETNLPDFQVDEMKNGQPWSIHQWRHGGDLQGVKGRLTYLNQLGVSTVVLSPIFLNAAGVGCGPFFHCLPG